MWECRGLQKGNLPLESPSRLALVDDWTSKWEAVVCGKTKPRSTRTHNEEGERLVPLALQVRGGAKSGSPEQGVVLLLGSCVNEERVVVKVSTLWRGLFCAVVSFSPVTNAAVC